MLERLVKMRRHAHRLLAGGGVGHEQHFLRLQKFAQTLQLLHERLVDFLPAGGVEDLHVARCLARPLERELRDFQHILFAGGRGENRDVDLAAERGELLDRRRTLQIARDEQRLRPCFFSQFASFAEEVVLPAPFRPTIRMRAGLSRFSGAASPPSSAVSSSWKILTICCPGDTERSTSSPSAFSFTRAMKPLATPRTPHPPRAAPSAPRGARR